MKQFYERVTLIYYVAATSFLMLLAMVLLAFGIWEVAAGIFSGDVHGLLRSVGLVIIGFAIVETSKFMAEEEIMRRKELRSAVEARRSLTKFITIIVIATSLEALVMVFEAGRSDLSQAVYPALLFASAMLALVALGLFQWLSSRIAAPPDDARRQGASALDHHGAEREAE